MNENSTKSLYDKVIHIAYGCGCVESRHVEQSSTDSQCDAHGDPMISFTEELVLRKPQAA